MRIRANTKSGFVNRARCMIFCFVRFIKRSRKLDPVMMIRTGSAILRQRRLRLQGWRASAGNHARIPDQQALSLAIAEQRRAYGQLAETDLDLLERSAQTATRRANIHRWVLRARNCTAFIFWPRTSRVWYWLICTLRTNALHTNG